MMDILHPSEFIREELSARGWSVDELAERMGLDPLQPVLAIDLYLVLGPNEHGILLGDLAGDLARAFGTSPQLWINLEAAWLRAQEIEARIAAKDKALRPLAALTIYGDNVVSTGIAPHHVLAARAALAMQAASPAPPAQPDDD